MARKVSVCSVSTLSFSRHLEMLSWRMTRGCLGSVEILAPEQPETDLIKTNARRRQCGGAGCGVRDWAQLPLRPAYLVPLCSTVMSAPVLVPECGFPLPL